MDDKTLEDLIPLLTALVTEGVTDFPAVLSTFSSRDATRMIDEYSSRISSVRQRQEEAGSKALGKLIRAIPAHPSEPVDAMEDRIKVDTSKPGPAPVITRKQGPVINRPLTSDHQGKLWKR